MSSWFWSANCRQSLLPISFSFFQKKKKHPQLCHIISNRLHIFKRQSEHLRPKQSAARTCARVSITFGPELHVCSGLRVEPQNHWDFTITRLSHIITNMFAGSAKKRWKCNLCYFCLARFWYVHFKGLDSTTKLLSSCVKILISVRWKQLLSPMMPWVESINDSLVFVLKGTTNHLKLAGCRAEQTLKWRIFSHLTFRIYRTSIFLLF